MLFTRIVSYTTFLWQCAYHFAFYFLKYCIILMWDWEAPDSRAGLAFGRTFNSDADLLNTLTRIRIRRFYTLMHIRIRILLLIKRMQFRGHWSTDPPQLYFERPRLCCEHPLPYMAKFWASTAPKFLLWCGSGFGFPKWCGSGSGFPKWCASGSAKMVITELNRTGIFPIKSNTCIYK